MRNLFTWLLFYLDWFLNSLRDLLYSKRKPQPFPLFKLPYLAQKQILLSMDLYSILTLSMCSRKTRRITEPYARPFSEPQSRKGLKFYLYPGDNYFEVFFEESPNYKIEGLQYIGDNVFTAGNFLVDFYRLQEFHVDIYGWGDAHQLESVFDIIAHHCDLVETVIIEAHDSTHLPLKRLLNRFDEIELKVNFDVVSRRDLILSIRKTEVILQNFDVPSMAAIWEAWNFKSLVVKPPHTVVTEEEALTEKELRDCVRRWMSCRVQESGKAHFVVWYQGNDIRNVLERICSVETLEPWEHEE